ncbi:MAG: hypothetical protein EZS28_018381 [Streblomastix strix]|uniref:Protein kinase domain-containing protein n=1 Tax=Streblomastix strix TaxID=222440 RepID=A0A5J4VU36_9EUKA|nr:MAG: hypothetical protein EZS28_018381 [Streblomastix strix]
MLQLILNDVADFGLAQKMASKTYLYAAGTLNYAAPETEQNKMTSESDVWSIGAIIIEVITGIHPFKGLTQQQTLSNISSGKYKPFPDYVQGELRIMLEGMISKDYRKRPTVKALLESETMQIVGMVEKQQEQKGSEQENEQMNKKVNELEMKVRSLEVEKVKEKNRANIAEQEKQKALTEKDKLIVVKEQEKQKEIQEKQKAQSERDQEKRRADTEHAEVISLTAEITRLNQLLLQVPSSLCTITYQSIIPDPDHVIQQENKIIFKRGIQSTVAFNPAITSGIVRFGGFFKDHSRNNFIIGIADSSAVFGSNERPWEGENIKKTVRYFKDGDLSHIGDWIEGNSRIELNKTVAMKVNMNIRPRTLTFFYDNQEQPLSVTDIPSSIRFYICLYTANSSFTITEFESVQYSSAKGGIKGQRIFEWGKEWKNQISDKDEDQIEN